MKFLYFIFVLLAAVGLSLGRDPRCLMQIDSGLCFGHMPRFAFDTSANECVSFVYGGCQGNENNFNTIEECQSAC